MPATHPAHPATASTMMKARLLGTSEPAERGDISTKLIIAIPKTITIRVFWYVRKIANGDLILEAFERETTVEILSRSRIIARRTPVGSRCSPAFRRQFSGNVAGVAPCG
jgi:hypothetical protein